METISTHESAALTIESGPHADYGRCFTDRLRQLDWNVTPELLCDALRYSNAVTRDCEAEAVRESLLAAVDDLPRHEQQRLIGMLDDVLRRDSRPGYRTELRRFVLSLCIDGNTLKL